MCGVTPNPILGPVPRSHAQLGVVAIRDWPPSGGQGLLNDVRGENPVDVDSREDVDGTAESAIRIEGVDRVSWRGVHAHRADAGVRLCLRNSTSHKRVSD